MPQARSGAFSATLVWRVAAAVLAINLSVFAMAAFTLYRDFHEYNERAAAAAQTQSRMLAQDIGKELEKIDIALLAAVDEIERQQARGAVDKTALNAFLGRLQGRVPEITGLRTTDAGGIVSYGLGVDPRTRLNNSDREYFLRQRNDPKAGLVVSRPVFARIDKLWVVPVSRAIHLPDGSFGGVVYANVALDHLAQVFTAVDVGRQGSVSLFDAQLRIFAQFPPPRDIDKILGEKLRVPGLQRMIETGQETGFYVSRASFDGIERNFAACKIPHYPLYAVVGWSANEVLGRWKEQVAQILVMAALFFLATLVSAWFIYRGWRRQLLASEELAREDEKFHTVADFTFDWEYWEGPTGELLYISPSCERITGYTPAEFAATPKLLDRIVHREDFHRMTAHRHDIAHLDVATLDFRIVRRDGEIRWIAHACQSVSSRDGAFLGRRISNRDITERKRAEEELHRLNRELRAIRDCSNATLRAENEPILLREVCHIICDVAGYRMAWVGYAEHDDEKTVRPVAWAGTEERYLVDARITWADTERGRGPTGTAIRTGASACVQNFATDPGAAPWRAAALERGYRSSIALPLKDESGTVFGALCIYARELNAFTEDETRLLEELAADLAFGITALRDRLERRKAEAQLLASEQLFRALVENSPDHIARYDRECRRIYVNPAIQKLFAEPAQKVLGRTPADKSPVRDPLVYIDRVKQTVATGTESTIEMPVRHLSGEWRWSHMRFIPEFGLDGKVATVLAIGHDIQDIKEKEQRFRMLAENFPDFVARFDRDGRYAYVNPALERAFGLPADAVLGKTPHELASVRTPEQNDALLAAIRRTFADGLAGESEVRWKMPQGERVFELRLVPERDAAGRVDSVIEITHDVTANRLAQQQRLDHLRFLEAMDRVNRAMQATNDLTETMRGVLDVVLSIFDCDRAFLLYPCDPGANTWSVPMERTKPEYPGVLQLGIDVPMGPDVAQTLRTLLATDDPVKFGPGTAHPLPADAAERFGFRSLMSSAIRPKLGKPWQFGIHQCSHARTWTTEEERLFQEIGRRLTDGMTSLLAHRDLREREAELTEAQRLGRIGSWKWDIATGLIAWSPENYRIYGHDPAQPLPAFEVHLAVYTPVSAAQLAAAVKKNIETGEAYELDLEIAQPPPGGARWVTARGEATRDAQGRIVGLHGTSQDITARKLAEEQIRELNLDLERHVAERTAQLEATSHELESFVYSVSHDLRIPLRAIDGYRGLLEKRIGASLDDDGRRFMRSISNAATRMGTLIDDLLSFSHMGRIEMSRQPVRLGTLVREAIDELASDIGGRTVHWRIADLPAVTGDPEMLHKVFVNLLANALKFTRARPEAEIEVGFREEADETVVFVRDNGVGFDMQYADKLFGVFQRLHGVDEFEGTGVGLANVRRIVARHGGRTWAEGRLNEGATFYFSLPRKAPG